MFFICIVKESSQSENGRCVLRRFQIREYEISHEKGDPHIRLSNMEREKICKAINELEKLSINGNGISIHLCEDTNFDELVCVLSKEEICQESVGEVVQAIEQAQISISV